jgi:hypothetical protein
MNAVFWLFNGLLALLAVVVTVAVLQFQPKLSASSPSGTDSRSHGRKGETALPAPIPEPQNRRLLANAKLDPLWQNSLFRPSRTEDQTTDAAATAETGARNDDMDLIGIGGVGKDAAAIIILPDRPAKPATVKPGAKPGDPAAKPPPTKRIFRTGETILDTGFTLKEIRFDEVTLARGEEERILKMKRGGTSSKSRRDQAQRLAATRTPPNVPPPPPTPPGNIPMPPPPPPMPVPTAGQPGAASYASNAAAREERLRQAIEARQKMIEQAKPKP